MRDYIAGRSGSDTLDGLRSLAVNVIGQAGYNQKQPWSPHLRELGLEATDDRSAYFSTLSMVANYFVESALMPRALFKLPIMSKPLQILGYHLQRMPQYTNSVLNEERKYAASGSAPRNNFLSLLIRLSDEEKRSQPSFSLTDEEISGNLFVFTTAGFETTSNAMGYTVALLAAHPEYQDWMREELQNLDSDSSNWAYDDVFPKCKRTLAIMVSRAPIWNNTRTVNVAKRLCYSSKRCVSSRRLFTPCVQCLSPRSSPLARERTILLLPWMFL